MIMINFPHIIYIISENSMSNSRLIIFIGNIKIPKKKYTNSL